MPEPEEGGGPSGLDRRRRAARDTSEDSYVARRAELVAVAADVFREKGYEETTLGDIAERFGTERASLYYYVASKEDLFQEAIQGVLDHDVEEAEAIAARDLDAPDKLRLLIERQLDSQERNYLFMHLYIQEQMRTVGRGESDWARWMASQTRRYGEVVRGVVEEGIAAGTIRADIDVDLLLNGLFGMLNWCHRWFRPGSPYRADQVAAAFAALFLDGAAQ
jgi:TetR/AcrR family transcriptional regulator, cholesterol catabolism regulator